MNEIAIEAVQNEIGGIEDNLFRARLQKRAKPSWVSGNGETIDEVISQYETRLKKYKAALQQLKEEV